ncbi:hypothetical protein F3O63_06390 [Clostridium sp. HV4-5-A1G]|jgi:hypothetical protein|uniref:hypothetical protein n=1 Tax=Clostridium sp. HV4-5-A1G TaxID=2004595 RepID=UPI00123BB2D0|nr:hypothetical protein [Clostridium sp. HV4-5-A1G]KAA8674824.1 hypothetical protein F3O63_06390 [Clostridium sp. HV4-5-A1G]
MEIIQVEKFIEILSSSTPKKIGILDNNTISFLINVSEYICIEKILTNYDLLLIPNWVYEEVRDSKGRVGYIEKIFNKGIKIFVVDERDYEKLINYKTVWLYKFFLYSSYKIGELKSFIKRYIEKGQALEELEDYQVWLNLLYHNGFEGKMLKNGRMKKKNAGEISISVLALIMSYIYFKANHTVTILSNDRDTYDFIEFAKLKLLKDSMFIELKESSITFKSNDFIIKESYLNNYINYGQDICSIIRFRDEKRVKYTKNALDTSVEEHDEILSNEAFIENLEDSTFNIIF